MNVYWMPVRLKPDLSTGETLNVGIGAVDPLGKLHVRLVPHLRDLLPLYGGRLGFDLSVLYDVLSQIETQCNGRPYMEVVSRSPDPQWELGRPVMAESVAVESLLDERMEDVVPLLSGEPPSPLFQISHQGQLEQSDRHRLVFEHYHREILGTLGSPISAAIWPYRLDLFGNTFWSIDLGGVGDTLSLTVMATGSLRLPDSLVKDPVIDVVDDIDAYYVTQALTTPRYVFVSDPFFSGGCSMDN